MKSTFFSDPIYSALIMRAASGCLYVPNRQFQTSTPCTCERMRPTIKIDVRLGGEYAECETCGARVSIRLATNVKVEGGITERLVKMIPAIATVENALRRQVERLEHVKRSTLLCFIYGSHKATLAQNAAFLAFNRVYGECCREAALDQAGVVAPQESVVA